MSSINLLSTLLDVLYDEKDNFSNENAYVNICDLVKQIGDSINTDTHYNDLLNEKENANFLRQSRNSYMKQLTLLGEKVQLLESQIKKNARHN